MSSIGSPSPFFFGGKKAYAVDRSLRFNRDDDAYLQATLGNSNLNKWTLSIWVKKPVNGEHQAIFSSGDSSVSTMVNFGNSDRLKFTNYPGSAAGVYITTRKFRDPSAWYHIVAIWDSGNATAGDRIRLYVNGVRETAFDQSDNPNQNQNSVINGNTQGDSTWGQGKHRIGRYSNYADNSGCYYAEVNFVDGQAYDPSYFGETDAITGQWKPKKYTGSYGTNGFYLNFSDNSGTTATTMGKDSSGNSNNFTPNNLATSDAVKDSPTNNFCTFNLLDNRDNVTLSEGNLKATGVGSWDQIKGTMGVSSGKWYFEIEADAIGITSGWFAGIHELKSGANYTNTYWSQNIYTVADYGYVYSVMDNNKAATNTTDKAFTSNITAGDIVGFRVDLDNNELSISVNGSDKGKVYDIQAGITYTPAVNFYASSSRAILNCGQDSTFAGAVSSGGNTDANGIGDFKYAVPSGYKAICSANLPDPTIKLPNKHFDTLLYTGDGSSSHTIPGLNFQPDWVWLKSRSAAHNHGLMDAVRGRAEVLFSNSTSDEKTSGASQDLVSFNSNGITVGTPYHLSASNNNGTTIVAWNWKAGGTASSNSDGTITSSVSANTTAGFSIATYTGNGTADATVGHGLGVAPEAVIVKKRSGTDNWQVYWIGAGTERNGYLNLSNAFNTPAQTDIWGTNVPTSTKFYLGTDTATNASGSTYVAYVFSGVEGYSKFGEYEGNGSTDGTFVYTGFAPAFLITRKIPETNWHMLDIDRDPSNPNTLGIDPNNSNAEADDSNLAIDFLSNGFKLRTSHSTSNGNATGYIYFAFAESPFKNARAR